MTFSSIKLRADVSIQSVDRCNGLDKKINYNVRDRPAA